MSTSGTQATGSAGARALIPRDISEIDPNEAKALFKMWQSGANSLPSSSAGRLFDAVASFAGVVQTSGYEGEAGLLMESLYDPKIKSRYDVGISDDIDFSRLFADTNGPAEGFTIRPRRPPGCRRW